ncbi:MAG TPA: hypothetical protein VF882_03600 [Gemmatimonadales bacterium]
MRTLRPLVVGLLVGAIAFACDRSPTAAPSPSLLAARVKPSSTTGSNKNTGLVVCSQTYDSVSKVIGPRGDTLQVGNHILWVDSLVLSDTVTITAVAPADTVRWVRFQPDGLVFPPSSVDLSYGLSTGALLYTNYKGCSVSSGDAVRIAQVNDSLSILGYLQTWSKVNRNTWSQGQQWVAGELPHFSNYAIAW